MSFLPAYPYVGRFGPPARHHPFANSWGSSGNDLAPFFRMLDDTSRVFDSIAAPFARGSRSTQNEYTWSPRFDVKEEYGSYELRGEVPGVESKDLDVQFTDEKTLTIKGRTEAETTSGNAPQATAEGELSKAPAVEAADEAAETSSRRSSTSYVKPSVEDADEASGEASSSTAPADTPTTVAHSSANAKATEQAQSQQPESKYWYSERSTGSFQRTFSFPEGIDQDGVTASLKNGLLTVSVPKAKKTEPRKIQVA